jgi:hypothetical protein
MATKTRAMAKNTARAAATAGSRRRNPRLDWAEQRQLQVPGTG